VASHSSRAARSAAAGSDGSRSLDEVVVISSQGPACDWAGKARSSGRGSCRANSPNIRSKLCKPGPMQARPPTHSRSIRAGQRTDRRGGARSQKQATTNKGSQVQILSARPIKPPRTCGNARSGAVRHSNYAAASLRHVLDPTFGRRPAQTPADAGEAGLPGVGRLLVVNGAGPVPTGVSRKGSDRIDCWIQVSAVITRPELGGRRIPG
jgi:hypothetical protein